MSIELISKHRKEIMAIGMIWIALYHSYFGIEFKPLGFLINSCGYGGVDLFMFLSGFGVYFSLKKDDNYFRFIRKRLIRVLPYNIIICIAMMFAYNRGLLETLLDSIGLSIYFRANSVNWYTSMLITLYVFSPLYYKLFKKKPELVTILGITIVFLVCLKRNYFHFMYAWFRAAVYMLGLYFGFALNENKKIYEIFWVILSIFGWGLMYYMYHYVSNDSQHIYPMILIVPGLAIILGYLLDKITIFNKPLIYLSKYTYQFFMIHLVVRDTIYNFYYGKLFDLLPYSYFDYFINILILVITFILALLLTYFVEKFEYIPINKKAV